MKPRAAASGDLCLSQGKTRLTSPVPPPGLPPSLSFSSYVATALALDQETNGYLKKYEACDNVDLEVVLCEYESYHYYKHQKYPKFIRKSEGTGECSTETTSPPLHLSLSYLDD